MSESINEAAAVEPQASPEVEVTEDMIRELAAQADGIPYKPSAKANTEAGPTPDQPTKDDSKQPEKAEVENKDSDESAPKAETIQDKDENRNASEASEKEEPKAEDSKKDSKRAKEEARLAESWKKLDAEKAQVRALQAELQKMKEEAEKASDPLAPSKPEELRKFARSWEEEGRDDLAKAARQQADLLEQRQKQNAEKAERAKREFNERWSSSVTRMISENPDLKDEQSDLGKRVVSILRSEDEELKTLINSTPNGFIYATQIAKMQQAAEASEALRKEVESLKKENTDLRKKTSLSASGSQAPAKRKSFEEMSYQEQEEFLRRNASDADKFGVLIGE